MMTVEGRFSEWYVAKFGPQWFRTLSGISFWPYSLMCACFPVIGGLFAPIHWYREIAIFIIYLIGLGISAHALDALGKNKPWGMYLSNTALITMAMIGFFACMDIAVYFVLAEGTYIILITGAIAIFFALTYNLEWFNGKLHTNGGFALVWGSWSMLVGYTFSGGYNLLVLFLLMVVGYSASSVEINASRPYRALKKQRLTDIDLVRQYQLILISIVLLVLSLTALLIVGRM